MSQSKVFRPLPALKRDDLPAKAVSNWKLWGPGAILVGLSIGAGEMIIWPRLTAQHGAGIVWAALLGVFIQLWINFEIGRWTIATGETVYTGYARAWRGFAVLFILFNILGWLAPGWARASGLALKALLVGPGGWGSDTFWTAITFGFVALALFGPKLVYKSVERIVEALVVVVTLGLAAVAFAVGTSDVWADLGRGALNIGYVPEGITPKDFFSAIVFAGAGGTANLFYSFYLRDKHIGMGARIPSMLNPLRGRVEKLPATGYTFPDTPENRSRFRAWWGYIVQDQLVFFWLLNSITISLFIFGALAVLHPRGIVPEPGSLIWDQSQILGEVWGSTGRVIFLLVGLATLFSTQLTIVDGVSRSIADIINTHVGPAARRGVGWWYVVIAGSWMVIGCLITFVMEKFGITELGFLLNAAYMGGFAMAVYVPMTLYINYRFLPRAARPGWICTTAMVIASIVYVGFAAYCLVWEVGRWMG